VEESFGIKKMEKGYQTDSFQKMGRLKKNFKDEF
jgi:hypothetical protein